MRTYDAATLAEFQARRGKIIRLLFWVIARNRTTGVDEPIGFWSGSDHRDFNIGGTRTYYGAGNLVSAGSIVMRAGTDIRMQTVKMSPLSGETAMMIRGYDPRQAPVEVHRAFFSTVDNSLIATPHRVFTGFVDDLDLNTPAENGEAMVMIKLASSARKLHQTLPLKKSDETQKLRSGDRILRYTDLSGAVDVWWGDKQEKR